MTATPILRVLSLVTIIGAAIGLAAFGARAWLLAVMAIAVVAFVVARVGGRHAQRSRPLSQWRQPLMIMVVGTFVAVTMMAAVHQLPAGDGRIDVTSDHNQSLPNALAAQLRSLPISVGVDLFAHPTDPVVVEMTAAIARFHEDKPNIQLHVRSPDDNDMIRGSLSNVSNVVVRCQQRSERLLVTSPAADLDVRLWQAMSRAARGAPKRLYVSADHGERELADDGRQGMRRFGEALRVRGLEPVAMRVGDGHPVPSDVSSLLVAAPSRVDASLLSMMEAVLAARGTVWVLVEPDRLGLDAWLLERGIRVGGALEDHTPFARFLGGAGTVTGTQLQQHPAVRGVTSGQVHFPLARALFGAFATGNDDDGVALVSTSSDATMDSEAGPFDLVRIANQPTGGRLLVVGDSTFLSDEGIAMGYNEELAVSLSSWVVQGPDEAPLQLPPPIRQGHLLLLTPSTREALAASLLWWAPMMWLWWRIAVVMRRRQR